MKSFDDYSIVIALNHLTDVVDAASQINLFKDYVMPVFVVLLSAITAYFIAIRGYQFQESSKNERVKADALNKIILQIQVLQSNLIAIKYNYFTSLESHPLQRALNVPNMPISFEKVNFDSNELAQLLYAQKVDIEKNPWMNISSFVATYGNYNQFVELLIIRNKLNEEVLIKLAPLISGSGARGEIQMKDVAELLDHDILMKYVDLTEKFITLVDDLIITMNDFLHNFPKKASEPLKKKYLKNYVYLNTYENQSDVFKELLVRCKEVNIDMLADIMKIDRGDAIKMYIENSAIIKTPNY